MDAKKLAALKSRMQDLDSLEVKPDFKGMIYGDSGSGKTVTAFRLAQRLVGEGRIILYVDSAQGWVSLENHPELKRRVKRMRTGGVVLLESIAEAIREGAGDFGSVGAIIIDEASTIATIDLDRVTTSRAEADSKGEKDPDTPTQPDFNTSGNRVRKAIASLVALDGLHVLIVSHLRRDNDKKKVEIVSPDFLPKLSKRLRELMHVVAYQTADTVVKDGQAVYTRMLQVHPSRTLIAKTRIGGFGPVISPSEFVKGVDEWIKGNRQTVEDKPEPELNHVVTPEPSESDEFTGIEIEGEE